MFLLHMEEKSMSKFLRHFAAKRNLIVILFIKFFYLNSFIFYVIRDSSIIC